MKTMNTKKRNWVIKDAQGAEFDGMAMRHAAGKKYSRDGARIINRVMMSGRNKVVFSPQ